MRTERFALSPCSQLYLRAVADPFGVEGGKACVPDLIDKPSFKCLQVARGTFAAGTGGIGFIIATAHQPTSGGVVWASDSTFSGTTIPNTTAFAGTIVTNNFNSNFVPTQFGIGLLDYRPVGAGLRIRYLGTELNRSGRVIPFRTYGQFPPTHLGGASAANFLVRPEVPSMAVDREWVTTTWIPMGMTDFNYNTLLGTVPVAGTPGNSTDLAFWVDGTAPGNAFEWELYTHFEIASEDGEISPTGITPSHSDVPGMSAIRNVMETNIPAGGNTVAEYDWLSKLISEYTPDDMSHVVSGMVKFGKAAAPLLLTM